jgi:cytochrome b561
MQPRYSPLNQALHWITALCVLAILPLAWVMTNAKDGPFDEALYNWHKTLGLIVLLVTAFRIVWRFIDKPPPYPPIIAAWNRVLAHIVYGLFFLVLLWMPITGQLATTYDGYPTTLFNLIPTPQLAPRNDHLARVFGDLHAYGQWMIYVLIGLHLCAVAFHLIWSKDGVLGRMLPAYAAEPRHDVDMDVTPTRWSTGLSLHCKYWAFGRRSKSIPTAIPPG